MEKKDALRDLRHQNTAKGSDWDQKDVVDGKDQTTRSGRGLQIWGGEPGGDEGQHGKAAEGTAARSARITEAQERAQKDPADEPG